MRKAKLIYNPNSGEKSIVNSLDFIISIYQKNNITLIPYRIDKNECIDKAFLDIDDTYEHLIIAGGDGTIDIIINAMKNLKQFNTHSRCSKHRNGCSYSSQLPTCEKCRCAYERMAF